MNSRQEPIWVTKRRKATKRRVAYLQKQERIMKGLMREAEALRKELEKERLSSNHGILSSGIFMTVPDLPHSHPDKGR